jgi:SPP1 family predicted phage head-tail adaptor
MRAGKLDRAIVLERLTTALDAYGVPVETWSPIATLRAERVNDAAQDVAKEFGEASETNTTFRTRFLADLNLTDRIVYDGEPREITRITEIGRRRGLELRTVAR